MDAGDEVLLQTFSKLLHTTFRMKENRTGSADSTQSAQITSVITLRDTHPDTGGRNTPVKEKTFIISRIMLINEH